MKAKNLFLSTRTYVAAAVTAVMALIAFFAGLFPEWKAPVLDPAMAQSLITFLAIVCSAAVLAFTIRKPNGGGVDVPALLAALVEVLQGAGILPAPPPQDENK